MGRVRELRQSAAAREENRNVRTVHVRGSGHSAHGGKMSGIPRFEPAPSDELVFEDGELLGCYIDVETSGLDAERDAIIQLAIVRFAFDADGKIGSMEKAHVYFEDPGTPLSQEIVELTGITDDMVRGKRLPEGEIVDLVKDAAIVIAHNAEFDRVFLEKRMKVFESRRFGCSYRDIGDWKTEYGCSRLRCLMLHHCGQTYDAHRADLDCYAGVRLLGTTVPAHNGKRALSYLLDAARVSHVRVYATGAPFEVKDKLKLRGYRWNPDVKVWYRDVIVGDAFVEECEWLKASAGVANPRSATFDSRKRFSNRIGVEDGKARSRVA